MTISVIESADGGMLVGDQRIELPHPIGEVLRYRGLIVVRLEPPAGVVFNRNVMAFTEAAELAWQIEESPHGTEVDKPYVDISIDDMGALVASNWNGVDYRVEPESGKVTVRPAEKSVIT